MPGSLRLFLVPVPHAGDPPLQARLGIELDPQGVLSLPKGDDEARGACVDMLPVDPWVEYQRRWGVSEQLTPHSEIIALVDLLSLVGEVHQPEQPGELQAALPLK